MRIKSAFNRIKNGYVSFVEKQGFAIITVVCVAVITATAVWGHKEEVYVSPTPPPAQDISAAHLMQQSLRTAATPAPTDLPAQWTPPLDAINLLRPFDADTMVQSSVTGIWSIHDGVDITAKPGAKVYAMADGEVLAAGQNKLQGVWLLIRHRDKSEALYAGLSLQREYLPGDKVFAGDVIGYTGSGPLDETDLEPHLHLRVTKNGTAVDPLPLWDAN